MPSTARAPRFWPLVLVLVVVGICLFWLVGGQLARQSDVAVRQE